METEQTNLDESQTKLEWGRVCTILSAVVLLLSIIFLIINIHYMTVLEGLVDQMNEAHQETGESVETTDCTTAPDDLIDILPNPEETIHTEETEAPTEPPSEPTEAPTTEETVPAIDPYDIELLACVVYQEAGGDSSCDNCRRRIADVVLNRVESGDFPNDIHSVLTAKGQYGSYYYTGVKWPARAKYDVEQAAVERAYRIAEEVLSGEHSDIYGKGYVWQAGFTQGSEGFWCCGTYFGRG